MKVPDPHRIRWQIGDWTDDSDQMILILESLTEDKGNVSTLYGFLRTITQQRL